MFIDLSKLLFKRFPNSSWRRHTKIFLSYAWLGILNYSDHKKANTHDVPKESNQNKSYAWKTFYVYLLFTVRHIAPRDWARTPLIRQVTLVQVAKLEPEILKKISGSLSGMIHDLAVNYAFAFRKIGVELFKNWLLRNAILLTAFGRAGYDPLQARCSIAEIGPGFGAVTTLAATSRSRLIYSYDTNEMQAIAKEVEKEVLKGTSKIMYRPTNNLNQQESLSIPDEEYSWVAFWSFTEIPLDDRKDFLALFENANYSLIATNNFFEGVNNFEYVEKLAEEIGAKLEYLELKSIFGSNLPTYMQSHRLYLFH